MPMVVPKKNLQLILLLLLFISFHPQYVNAQNPGRLPFDSFIAWIEQKHDVTFYYKSEWVVSQHYDTLDQSLPQLMEYLLAGQNLTAIYLDDMVVLVPHRQPQTDRRSESLQQITVGNQVEAGRSAKAVITGNIMDGNTGEPLIGAVLYNEKTKSGTTTDLDGSYEIELPVGQHIFRISYVGYEDRIQHIRLLSDGQLNLDLFEQSVRLDEFTVTAQRAEVNLTRTQMSLISLDSRTLKQIPGSFGEPDILKSFTLLPGVQSIGEFGTGFHIRGGSADQNLILLEDVPLFNTSHLFGLISVVNPDMVSQVSMMKAGLPARYGERASSVVDIRMSGQVPEKTQLKGGIGLLNSRLLFETPLFNQKASLAIGGRSSYSNWFLQSMPDLDLMNSDARFYDLSAVFSAALNPSNNITIFGYQSHDGFSYAGETQYEYSSLLASFRWNSIINDRFMFRLSGGLSDYDYQVSEDRAFSPGKAYKMQSAIAYRNAKLHFDYYPHGERSYDFGLQAYHYEIMPGERKPAGPSSFVKPFTMETEQALELAAFVNSRLEFNEVWGAEIGLRYVHYLQLGPGKVFTYEDGMPKTVESITDTTYYAKNETGVTYQGIEPRLSLRYMLDDSRSVKLSYSHNHQFIQLISNTSLMTPADVWKLSDKHLKPLLSKQLALGYYRNFYNNLIETSVEVYYKQLDNLIEYKNGASIILNPHVETDLVSASGHNYGLELYIRGRYGRVSGWTSYTYSASMRQSHSPYASDQINRNALFPSSFDRPHNLVINANYDISRRWAVNMVFTFNSGRPVTLPETSYEFGGHEAVYYSDRNKYRLPDYHRLDLTLSYGENLRLDQRGKGSWSLSVINVYGRKNPYTVFYKKDAPTAENNFRHYSTYQLYVIGRPLPTLTYNFSF